MQFHFHTNQSYFHKNSFALRLALKQRRKGTRKWPIQFNSRSPSSGYTDQFITSCQSTAVSTNQSQANRGSVTLPTFKEFQKKIARILNQFNINVAHKPIITDGKFSKDFSTGAIYKINYCKYCDKFYIGQISRSRTREHQGAIDRNSLLTQNCIKCGSHDFDLDDFKVIDRCSRWSKILFFESWHSIREPNAIN